MSSLDCDGEFFGAAGNPTPSESRAISKESLLSILGFDCNPRVDPIDAGRPDAHDLRLIQNDCPPLSTKGEESRLDVERSHVLPRARVRSPMPKRSRPVVGLSSAFDGL